MKKIYFFTNSYPFDIGEQWKTNEINGLKKYFKITVIPFYSYTKKEATELISAVSYQKPIFEKLPYVSIKKRLLLVLFSKFSFVFLKELINSEAYKNKTKFIQWVSSSHKILFLNKNKKLKFIFKNAEENAILYFFWGKETSEIIPILKTKAKAIVRFHGYDLYEDRNHGYIPYRREQLKKLHSAFFVSEQGLEYLKNRYESIKFNAHLFRLGTVGKGKSKISEDSVLRIFSCSSIIPLKRIDLIAKAIISLNFNVEWTHIGGGDMLDNLETMVKNRPPNIKIKYVGQVKSEDVKHFYVDKYADLFINASTSEGVPVSIMEAMSASIPVFATDVGGSGEIVNNKNGKLLNADITVDNLKDEITMFYNLPKEKKIVMRKEAYNTYKKLYNAKTNAENLAVFLDNL